MDLNVCLRCHSKFYQASSYSDVRCPVCDYTAVSDERRGRNRVELSRSCEIYLNHVKYTAKTVNISVDGVALELKRSTKFKANEQVKVSVCDFDIEVYSSIAWVTSIDKTYVSMGLCFNNR